MKILVVSDIHGSSYYAKKAIEKFKELKADKLLLLGDLMYHGPRNPLTKDYDPLKVSQILNEYAKDIYCVRGNCDSEVDQMLLDFNITSDYIVIVNEGRKIFVSHGHVYNPENLPLINNEDIFIFGHIHLPIAKKENNKYILNPGSIALPKENNPNSYGVFVDDCFKIFDIDDNLIKEISFNN